MFLKGAFKSQFSWGQQVVAAQELAAAHWGRASWLALWTCGCLMMFDTFKNDSKFLTIETYLILRLSSVAQAIAK